MEIFELAAELGKKLKDDARLIALEDAKKAYVHTTAAVLRVKDCVMNTATSIQENCEDILAEAKSVNEARAAEEEKYVGNQEEVIG